MSTQSADSAMEDKVEAAQPYKATPQTTRDAFAHVSAVGICTGVLFLFVALTYSQITLPRYTTESTEKDVQQVVNLIITVTATVVGILFSHCRRLTNEAETKSELRDDELTIARLHVHFEAASGSKVAMGMPVARNRSVWGLVAFYFMAMIIFAFIHSVLSVIFVIEDIISDKGEQVAVPIPLSIDIPYMWKGKVVDSCSENINSPDCTYMLALHSLSSQLVTYQPYSIAGVTFEPPNGTMGLPYHAMKHFQDEVAKTPFQSARRRYCLPVMDPQVIKCTEVLVDGTTCESADNFVKFETLNVTNYNEETGKDKYLSTGLYKITSPYPNPLDNYGASKLRVDNQGRGVMVIQRFSEKGTVSLIGAGNAWGEVGYASMLHRLMYDGAQPDFSGIPEGGTYDFAARCELTEVQEQDNVASSWRQVDFTLDAGVLRANVTSESCPNPRGEKVSGFSDLEWALELAGAVISGSDGYSAFFNEHPPVGQGTNIFANMSRLDTIVNQIYHLVQTGYSESQPEYAMQIPAVHNKPIAMITYPHLFVIRISWTPTTYVGLVLSILITLNSWVLAWRWFKATYRFGFGAETWNLLRPIDLMAYSLAGREDLEGVLESRESRRGEMRGETMTRLKEIPLDRVRMLARHGVVRVPTGSSSGGSGARDGEKMGEVAEREIEGPRAQSDVDTERGS